MSNIGKVVNLKFEAALNTKGKPYKKYAFTVNGKEYKANTYGVFGGKADMYEGMPVMVSEVEKDGFRNIIVEHAPANAEVPEPVSAPVKPSAAAANVGKTQGGWNDASRNDAIEAQSARRDAIETLKLGLEAGAYPKVKFTGKGDGERALLALIEHTTSELFNMTRRIAKNEKSPFEGAVPAQQKDFEDDDLPFGGDEEEKPVKRKAKAPVNDLDD